MLIAEKCANRSSPPPSGVMNPKPFASLNHFTVPVAIFSNPSKQVIIGSRPGRCFDQGQESTAFRRQRTSRTGRALVLETKHEADYTHYRLRGSNSSRSSGTPGVAFLHQTLKLRPDLGRPGHKRLQFAP